MKKTAESPRRIPARQQQVHDVKASAVPAVPLLLVLAATARAQSSSSTAQGDVSDASIIAVFVGLILVALLLWSVRRLLLRRIRQQMMVASTEQPSTADSSQAIEQSSLPPSFNLFEADNSPVGGSEARRHREREAQRLFRRVCLADLAVAAMYAALPFVFGLSQLNDGIPLVLGLTIAGFTAVRYWLHRRQFRAFNLSRSRRLQKIYRRLGWVWRVLLFLIGLATGATASNLVYVPDILRAIFGARVRNWLSVAVPLVAGTYGATIAIQNSGPERMAGVGLMVAATAHAVVFTRLVRRLRTVPGIHLLILRVFNIDATSSFIFSGLMRYWRHFGNHFTIVDPSMVRQGYSNSSTRSAFIWMGSSALLFIFYFVVSALLGEPDTWYSALALVAAPSLSVAGLAFAIGRHRIDSRFTRSRKQIVDKLKDLDQRPRHFDLTFRHAQVLCHDNTWFPAVEEFAGHSHAVLMDLRGYTPERKGCQREVDFLFDAVPLQRLLFLIDVSTDGDAVRQLLLDRWAFLQESSPNLSLTDPVIQLYLSRDNDERDMQAILDCLIEIADSA